MRWHTIFVAQDQGRTVTSLAQPMGVLFQTNL